MRTAGGRRVSAEGRLAALGFDPDVAITTLERVGLWGGDGPAPPASWDALAVLSDTPRPSEALRVVAELAARDRELFAAAVAEDRWWRRLCALAGGSRPLAEFACRDPAAVSALRDDEPVDLDRVAAEAAAAVSGELDDTARSAALARLRRREMARIAARDLAGELSVEVAMAELSALAAGILRGTFDALRASTAGAARLAVIAMGKLGGGELNYVSDVDVLFVHDVDGSPDAAHDEARRTAEALLRLLNSTTPDGRPYEIDASLRPEGRAGPLSRTLDSYVAYWERWARPWEFQALLRARPVAGDPELGEAFMAAAGRFVWPETLPAEAVAEIRELKARAEAHAGPSADRNLKLGPGGLRDVEFTVQVLQLIHGRADPSLRVTGTLPALAALADGGYVAEEDARTFADAYRFLRRLEHRLQLAGERRTHTLPDRTEDLEALARAMGARPDADRSAAERLEAELTRVRAAVRALHLRLFYGPIVDIHAAVPTAAAELAVGRALSRDAAVERLRALGFRDGDSALRHIAALTAGVTRRARTLRVVLPAVLHTLADTPDPDEGLQVLRRVVEAHGDDAELVVRLRDHPPAAELIARLVGTSPVAGELLAAEPQALDLLLDEAQRGRRPRDELVAAVRAQLRWHDGLQERTAALRRFKRRELLRTVVRDLDGRASVAAVGEELTDLAEACLDGALAAVQAELGTGPARIAVIAMGRFGGRELTYPSDLDVLFVHEPLPGADEHAAAGYAVRTAELLVRTLSTVTAEGRAFDVDADLRPEGRSGPLCRSLDAYHAYYERWAEPWEFQALLRARPVAGDPDLAARFAALAARYAYPEQLSEQALRTLRRIKARIERERLPRGIDPRRHLKLGPGGMADVEWTVQLLQQRYGGDDPVVRTPGTMAAIDALQDRGWLDSRDATWLRDGYRLLTRIRNRLYLLRARDPDLLPGTADGMERLARALGYGRGGRQELAEDHRRVTRRVRQVTERLFYGGE